MSKNREKVFDDPLSMFGGPSAPAADDDDEPAPVKKTPAPAPAPAPAPVAKAPVKVEPVAAPAPVAKPAVVKEELPTPPAAKKSSLFDDPAPKKKSSVFDDDDDVSLPSPVVAAPAAPASEPLFRELNVDKVTLKKDKKKAEVVDNTVKVSQAERGLGFNTNLWDNDLLATAGNSKGNLDDIFGASSNKDVGKDDSIFSGYDASKATAKKDDDISRLRLGGDAPSSTTEVRSINIRAKNDTEEAALADLQVSKLLEREEDLDFDTFGKVKMDNNVHITKTIKKNKDVFDLESEDYLNELSELTSANRKGAARAPAKAAAAAPVAAAPVVSAADIDMSSLDLDAYISAQQSSSGGGLFD